MKFLRVAVISSFLAGVVVLISSTFKGEIAGLLQIPGNIINLLWEEVLFEITKDPYYSLGDGTILFYFLFYLAVFIVIVGIIQMAVSD